MSVPSVDSNSPLFPSPKRTPEHNLIAAILIRAVVDLDSPFRKEQILAADWIWPEQDNAHQPFSFAWCCEQLDLSPKALRNYSAKQLEGNYGKPRISRGPDRVFSELRGWFLV